jgi:N-sulfoglucosamine sulfohydrolase
LYDLEADPHEVKNLAAVHEHSDRLARMHEKLVAWQQRTGDPWIIKYQHE